jgi:hypothetical protein
MYHLALLQQATIKAIIMFIRWLTEFLLSNSDTFGQQKI